MSLQQQTDEPLNQEIILKAINIANNNKVNQALSLETRIPSSDASIIKDAIETLEFSAINLWEYSLNNRQDASEKMKKFNLYCADYCKLLQTMPIPENKNHKIKYVLKLLTFSYLGENWQDIRRFIIENEPKLLINYSSESDGWNDRLLTNIYLAIFYLIRKKDWNDLSKAMEIVKILRDDQKKFEKSYIDTVSPDAKVGSAFELAALYHLAKSVELIANYMCNGQPNDVTTELDFHLDQAILFAQNARIIELDIILRMLKNTFKKMIYSSIWYVTKSINSRVTKFVKLITKANKPIFELLYPQRIAIAEKGLLDPTNKAIVVNLPTSSGKTLIAEFRILQALNQFSEEGGWIAYVAPTKALVNQITARLKRDLSQDPLNIKVEKMSGALEIDAFENNMISKRDTFNILVTTPEKLSLLIRQDVETRLGRQLVLAIIDEAHNLSDAGRGLNLELLLSIIKKDCSKANLLLLTPFIPNSDDVAKWLDESNPKSISIELNWQPNEKTIGVFYPKIDKDKNLNINYTPLITSMNTIATTNIFKINKDSFNYKHRDLIQKYKLSAAIASELDKKGSVLVMVPRVEHTWKIAQELYKILPAIEEQNKNIKLVKKYVAAELGDTFPLVSYLDKGIGIHHSGLPDDIKLLLEWLMEEESLKVLVSTTTLAQGINFEIPTILITSPNYPAGKRTIPMPMRDFWNVVGRAGRVDHKSLGLVGLISKDAKDQAKIAGYVKKQTESLVSVLVDMVNKAITLGNELNLSALANNPEWSMFLQYISHMYKQSKNLNEFLADINLTLRGTYGYNQLNVNQKQILNKAVKDYSEKLDKNKSLASLSDKTGFSPETLENAIMRVKDLQIKQSDWNTSNLFVNDSDTLKKLMGLMLSIPEVKDLHINIKGTKITYSTLSGIINDWVSGKEIIEISKEYFGGADQNSVSECVHTIYSKITNYATWGLSAIQKLPDSGIELDKLTENEKNRINNLPAMIFYGVREDEAILMRMNNAPRSISSALGKKYKSEVGKVFDKTSQDVYLWLKNLKEKDWEEVAPKNKNISGNEYREIWQKLSGIN